jgi:glutaredoxin
VYDSQNNNNMDLSSKRNADELYSTRSKLRQTRRQLRHAQGQLEEMRISLRITMQTIPINFTSLAPIMAIVLTEESRQLFVDTFMQSNGCVYCDFGRKILIVTGSHKNVRNAVNIIERNISMHRQRAADKAKKDKDVMEYPEFFIDIPV